MLGVSPDDAASHVAFKAKFALSFSLLCDEDMTLMSAYGAAEGGRVLRSTVWIDEGGIVRGRWASITDHAAHAAEVLAEIREA